MKIFPYTDVEAKDAEGGSSKLKVRWLITKETGAENFVMRLFEMEAGGNSPFHTHAWEHEVVVTAGSGFVLNVDQKIAIEKDDFILVPPGRLHQFIAGEQGMSMVCVVPNEGQPK